MTSRPDPTAVRTEKDTFGPIDVPADRLWGAQTQRSLQNFDISGEHQPREIIHALALVKRAHELGLKVMIDQVLSHTADSHPWFVESRSSRDNPKADWYVWADCKQDGNPPNNWLSIFGGSAWQWDTRRCQYYLHNFLTSQPDLNFHNPEVQDALLDTVKFWLELGVDGYRLDTVNFYFHDAKLRDNPPRGKPSGDDPAVTPVNPYAWQWHKFDKSQPENLKFLQRLRSLLDQYPNTTMVGEVGDDDGLARVAEYTSGGDKLPAQLVAVTRAYRRNHATLPDCKWSKTGLLSASYL